MKSIRCKVPSPSIGPWRVCHWRSWNCTCWPVAERRSPHHLAALHSHCHPEIPIESEIKQVLRPVPAWTGREEEPGKRCSLLGTTARHQWFCSFHLSPTPRSLKTIASVFQTMRWSWGRLPGISWRVFVNGALHTLVLDF